VLSVALQRRMSLSHSAWVVNDVVDWVIMGGLWCFQVSTAVSVVPATCCLVFIGDCVHQEHITSSHQSCSVLSLFKPKAWFQSSFSQTTDSSISCHFRDCKALLCLCVSWKQRYSKLSTFCLSCRQPVCVRVPVYHLISVFSTWHTLKPTCTSQLARLSLTCFLAQVFFLL